MLFSSFAPCRHFLTCTCQRDTSVKFWSSPSGSRISETRRRAAREPLPRTYNAVSKDSGTILCGAAHNDELTGTQALDMRAQRTHFVDAADPVSGRSRYTMTGILTGSLHAPGGQRLPRLPSGEVKHTPLAGHEARLALGLRHGRTVIIVRTSYHKACGPQVCWYGACAGVLAGVLTGALAGAPVGVLTGVLTEALTGALTGGEPWPCWPDATGPGVAGIVMDPR